MSSASVRVKRSFLVALDGLLAGRADLQVLVITGVEHTDSYRYMYDGYVYEARVREKSNAREPV